MGRQPFFTSDLQLRKLFTIPTSIPKRDSVQSTILVFQWRSGISSKPIYIQTTLTRKSDDKIEIKTIQVCNDKQKVLLKCKIEYNVAKEYHLKNIYYIKLLQIPPLNIFLPLSIYTYIIYLYTYAYM